MINLSIWNCRGLTNLEDVIKLTEHHGTIRNNATADGDCRSYTYSISEKEGFDINGQNNIIVNGENIRFLFLNVRIERLKKYWDSSIAIDSGISDFNRDVIFYEQDGYVKLLILAARTNAVNIIKYMFAEEHWGNIEESNYICEDLLYWLFYKLHNFECTEELVPNSSLFLMGLKSYMGKTRDEVNAVRGSGVRISALLGTLAFIFNNEDLRALRPEFQYNEHCIVSEINKNNVNRIDERSCSGTFDEYEGEERNVAILIFTAKIIMPILQNCYKESIENNIWSIERRLSFLQEIGVSIRNTVDQELQRIAQEQVKICEDNADEFIDEEIENEEFID